MGLRKSVASGRGPCGQGHFRPIEALARIISPAQRSKGRVVMRRQWTFLLYITLAAATAMPALGQTIASESRPASGVAKGAASVPEFTGVWTHPAFPWFEPPASGPGPVTNKSRWPQQPMDASGTIALPPLPPGVDGVSDYDQL